MAFHDATVFRPNKLIPRLAMAGLMLSGCGDDGYDFGEYGEALDRLDSTVTAFCLRAVSCVSSVYGDDADNCRLIFLSYASDLATDQDCGNSWIELLDCYKDMDCLEFPLLYDKYPVSGAACQSELETIRSCYEGFEP